MKILKWLGVLLVATVVALLGSIYARNKAVGPTGWAEDNTIKQLKLRMKDPESMVIRASYTVTKIDPKDGDKTIAICGVVDGKNSFGGFSGGQRFMSRSVQSDQVGTFDTYDVILEDAEEAKLSERVHMLSSFDKVYWNEHCVDEAHPAVEVKS